MSCVPGIGPVLGGFALRYSRYFDPWSGPSIYDPWAYGFTWAYGFGGGSGWFPGFGWRVGWQFGGWRGDHLEGDERNDWLFGLHGDDTLVGGGGNDFLAGGAGYDSASYSGTPDEYEVSRLGPLWTVRHVGGDAADGYDILLDVERLVFADGFEFFLDGRNNVPFAMGDAASVDESDVIERSADAGLLGNDIDFDGDALVVATVEGSALHVGTTIVLPSGALLTVNQDGSYVYDPNGVFDALGEGQQATDSFTYQAGDGLDLSASVTVEITITGSVALSRGAAIDGYVSGAIVYADANGNGVLDGGEASARTDAGGNFVLADASGRLILSGGVDVSTGLLFPGQLLAPAGSSVVTPLTTLIVHLMDLGWSQADAAAIILDGFGFDLTGDLAEFDPIAAALSGDPEQSASGIAAQSVAAQVHNSVVQIAALLNGAGLEPGQAYATAFEALAAALATGAPVDLSDPATVEAIVEAAAAGAPLSAETLAGASRVIAQTNDAVQDATGDSDDAPSVLEQIAQVQVVVQTGAAPALTEAGGSDDSSAAEGAFTDEALADAVEAAADDIGDIDGGTTGSDLPETFAGTGENDFIDGRGGDDVFDLRAYSKLGYEITIGQNGAPSIIRDIDPEDGDTGTDTLVSVELAFFADARVFLDGRNGPPVLIDRISTPTPENQVETGFRYTVEDPDGDDIGYALVGGADQHLFDIDPVTGTVTFKVAPDFEDPGDSGGDNSYELVIRASDFFDFTDIETTISITNIDEAPVFSSPTFVSLTEGGTLTPYSPAALDPEGQSVEYDIIGGADAAKFRYDATTGELRFLSVPDFEAPGDADGDNIYEVAIGAFDGTTVSNQLVRVRVTDSLGDLPLSYFVKFDGISHGNSTDPQYPADEGWIALDSFVFAVDGDIVVSPGETEISIGPSRLSSLSLNFGAADFDMAGLDANLLQNTPMANAVIVGLTHEAVGPNGTPPANRELVRLELDQPMVTASRTEAGPDGLDQSVVMDFERLTYETDGLTQDGQIVAGEVFRSEPSQLLRHDAAGAPESPTGDDLTYVLRFDDETWLELEGFELSVGSAGNQTGELVLTRMPDGFGAAIAAWLESPPGRLDIEVWQTGGGDPVPVAGYRFGSVQFLSVEQSDGAEVSVVSFAEFSERFGEGGDGTSFTTPGASPFDEFGWRETTEPVGFPEPVGYYLKLGEGAIDSVYGDAPDSWIEVEAFQHGLSVSSQGGGSGQPSSVDFSGLVLDLADANAELPGLLDQLLQGSATNAALVGISADGQGGDAEVFRLELTAAMVNSVETTAGEAGLDYRLSVGLHDDAVGAGLKLINARVDPDGDPIPPLVFEPDVIDQQQIESSIEQVSGDGDGLITLMRLEGGDWFEIDGFDYGVHNDDGARSGAVVVERVSDDSSAAFMEGAATGDSLGLMEIEIWRVDGSDPEPVAAYDFREVLASGFVAGGDGTERLEFMVEKLSLTTQPSNGSGAQTVAWDFLTNTDNGAAASFDWDRSIAAGSFGGELKYYLHVGDGSPGEPQDGDYDLDPDWIAVDDFSYDAVRPVEFGRGEGLSAGRASSGGLSINVDSGSFDFPRFDAMQFGGTVGTVTLVGVRQSQPNEPDRAYLNIELSQAVITESSTLANVDGMDHLLVFEAPGAVIETGLPGSDTRSGFAFEDHGSSDPAEPLQIGDHPSNGDALLYVFNFDEMGWQSVQSFELAASTSVSTGSTQTVTDGLTITRAGDDLSALYARLAAEGDEPALLDLEVWQLEEGRYVPLANYTYGGVLVEDVANNGDGTETIRFEFTEFASRFAIDEGISEFEWDIPGNRPGSALSNDFDWIS